jgi:hypothetical protein|tara:strand:- start:1474 stop:1938 length:465 start_codon:yes stop_codon:yes gene_type:complete
MKKWIGTIAVLLVAAGMYAAFTDIDSPQYYGKINIPKTHAALDANFALLESGAGAGATALSVTNGQAVTVAAGVYVVSGIGGADNTTNTITLVAPTVAGQKVTLLVATASTNLVAIADSGTVAASGGIELDGNDTAALQAVDTSTWCLLSESDN